MRPDVVADFVAQGGRGLVTVGCDYKSSQDACNITKQIREKFPSGELMVGVEEESCVGKFMSPELSYQEFHAGATIWIHPSEVCFWAVTKENIAERMDDIKVLYAENKALIYAIGECGTDLHYEWANDVIQLQQELLALQCQFALDVWLPVVIHSRDSFQETVDVLKQFPWLTYYIHCFGYGTEELQYFLENFENVCIGYDCNISYPKAQNLRDACMMTPLENMLLETDSPYLAPQSLRGTINTPLNVQWLYQYIANLRGIAMVQLQENIAKNYKRIYGGNSDNLG